MRFLYLISNLLSPKQWDCSMIWCLSQMQRSFIFNGYDITFYCRWRWDDPWTFDVIVNGKWIGYKIPYFTMYDYTKLKVWIDRREWEIVRDVIKSYET